ncbi:MAG: DUF2817 domain-containing protein [Cellvibrionaceae bacterium]
MSESYFSETYAEARQRFKEAATAVGASINSYRIDSECQDELAIDVAIIGPDTAPTVVTSSGVHGVEGFFGSAVQLALLNQFQETNIPPNIRYVLIHAVNPFGFSRFRRFNEDNVDLNRNFLTEEGRFKGTPDAYVRLNRFLNPESPPSRFEPFKLKAMWNIFRHGLQPLKQALAGGQYDYPQGVFFGGHGPCQSTRIIYDNCDAWMGESNQVVHIDLHTGLGAFAKYKLLLTESADSIDYPWYTKVFGKDSVEAMGAPHITSYQVNGIFGEWLQKHFASRQYRFVTAEFGTYDIIRVFAAIRAENRAYHYGVEDSPAYQSTKAEMLECFCPSDTSWRKQVIEFGLEIINQATQALEIEVA